MQISDEVWTRYIERLRNVNDTAAREMFEYLATHDWYASSASKRAAVDFAFALATKYGEAATEAACEMYDSIATAFAAGRFAPADPAATATYDETAKAMYGGMKKTRNIQYIADITGRLVKQAGADTMTMNALRDGAEWAWIPSGDSCAYCIMLSSRGWQKASAKALRNGHAEHIHANCDCNYCVRFDEYTTVENYNPEELLEQYNEANTDTQGKVTRNRDKNGVLRDYKQSKFDAKVNAMRRADYAKNKDKINAQKRAAYAYKKGDGTWKYT